MDPPGCLNPVKTVRKSTSVTDFYKKLKTEMKDIAFSWRQFNRLAYLNCMLNVHACSVLVCKYDLTLYHFMIVLGK